MEEYSFFPACSHLTILLSISNFKQFFVSPCLNINIINLFYLVIDISYIGNTVEDQKTPVTIENLIETLKNLNVVNIHDFYYMALYDNSYIINAVEENSSLMLDRKYYTIDPRN